MARTLARLPPGARITDYISLGVVAQWFPRSTVERVLADSGKSSRRRRDLPAHVVVYYVVALALYMQVSYREVLRCLLEGLQWLQGPRAPLRVASHSGISRARTRLGWEPLEQLHDERLRPLGRRKTKGAFYRRWRLISLDGSTLDVADEKRNREAFGRPGASRGSSPFRKSASSRCWKTVRTFCSPAAWGLVPGARSHWRNKCCRPSRKGCCAWRIATSWATNCGHKPAPAGRSCCGGGKRIYVCRSSGAWPTAPT